MATEQKDNWSSQAYQNSASFVPKLATTVIQWLDPQPDDTILDIGCGDGIIDLQIAQILSKGSGTLHGIDSSQAMISAAEKSIQVAGLSHKCTFQVLDATTLPSNPTLLQQSCTKIFSNAALHWILRPPSTREPLFHAIKQALVPGGRFVFEMGGLGNISEIRAAVLSAVSKRVGLQRAVELEPWFFPDETWMRDMLDRVGGWEVERLERVWRPTDADRGGVEGWVRLMCKAFLDGLEDGVREEVLREVVDVLEVVCRKGDGWMFGYVRLRGIVRRV